MALPKHCNGCFYRRNLGSTKGEKFCSYILLEKASRGCDVENCDKKIPGKQTRKNGLFKNEKGAL